MDQATVAEPVDLASRPEQHGRRPAVEGAGEVARRWPSRSSPDLPPVRGFVGELNQIWANLIDNALDAIPASGRVDVHAARQRHARASCASSITGPGFPTDVRDRIFDPFFTTKPVGQGTGLGLDIVRRLVRHNDGEIDVESRPGRTEFRVALPAAGTDGTDEVAS